MNFEDYDIRQEKNGQKVGDYLNYRDMIKYFTDDCLILNNTIINYEVDYWECITNNDYYETEDGYSEYIDIYQYYIIGEYDAERLKEHTNEIIYYNSKLDMYLLGVSHFGTSWSIVPSDFIAICEDENYIYYKLEG